jgi:hypothetical protein
MFNCLARIDIYLVSTLLSIEKMGQRPHTR